MRLILLRLVVAIVRREGRMQMRTFYRTLRMASAVTATHQQTLKESEFLFIEPTRLSGPASPRGTKPATAQEMCRVIDEHSGSDKQGDPCPLADTTNNGLDEHLEGGVGFAGVHSRT